MIFGTEDKQFNVEKIRIINHPHTSYTMADVYMDKNDEMNSFQGKINSFILDNKIILNNFDIVSVYYDENFQKYTLIGREK